MEDLPSTAGFDTVRNDNCRRQGWPPPVNCRCIYVTCWARLHQAAFLPRQRCAGHGQGPGPPGTQPALGLAPHTRPAVHKGSRCFCFVCSGSEPTPWSTANSPVEPGSPKSSAKAPAGAQAHATTSMGPSPRARQTAQHLPAGACSRLHAFCTPRNQAQSRNANSPSRQQLHGRRVRTAQTDFCGLGPAGIHACSKTSLAGHAVEDTTKQNCCAKHAHVGAGSLKTVANIKPMFQMDTAAYTVAVMQEAPIHGRTVSQPRDPQGVLSFT